MQNITLEQIAGLAASITPAKIEVIREDYDEYGSEWYVEISGECANIKIEQVRFGFDCFVIGHNKEDKSSEFKYNYALFGGEFATCCHRYIFRTKEYIDIPTIDDINEIGVWLKSHVKYLKASSELFERIDRIFYPDLRGAQKMGNGITSYDCFLVCDEDFYVDSKIKDTRRVNMDNEPKDDSDYI